MDSMVNHYTVSKAHRKTDAYTPRRHHGQAARLCRDGLLQSHPQDLSPQAHHHRRHRGEPAQAGALRLLVGQAQALDPARFAGRSSDLRHGRARRGADRGRAQRRHGRAGHHVHRRDRLQDRRRRRSCPLHRPPVLSRDPEKRPRLRRELPPSSTAIPTPFCAKRLIEPYSEHEFVVQNPPQKPLEPEGDGSRLRSSPTCRTYHPSYKKARRHPGDPRDRIQPDLLPRLLLARAASAR